MEADCDRYDRRLLKAAAMLGVAAPTGLGREQSLLSEDRRRQMEDRLAELGLDVRAAAESSPN